MSLKGVKVYTVLKDAQGTPRQVASSQHKQHE